jgi:hypothetical protein
MRRLGSLPLAALLLVLGSTARAGEPASPLRPEPAAENPVDEAPVPPTPGPSTTVIAAPDGPGVTVVAPTAHGGTVIARDCGSVTVTGSPTIVDASGQPLCPFKPPKPEIRYVYVEVPVEVERRARPKFAADSERGGAIVIGALAMAIGSLGVGTWYANSVHDDVAACKMAHATTHTSNGYTYSDYGDGYSGCSASVGIGPLVAYTSLMSFAPMLGHFVVGSTTRGWIYAAVIASSIAFGKVLDASTSGVNDVGTGGWLFGFILPTTLGIVALATTPHREDLVEKNGKPRVVGFSLAPIVNRGGASGGIAALAGTF